MSDDSGPAFPLDRICGAINCGLTKREWYAGMAMAGIRIDGITVEEMVHKAFAIADAMLAEAKK